MKNRVFPSIAAGDGPFNIQNTGNSGGGYSASPGKHMAGEFGVPMESPDPIRYAVEAHEYMHLVTDNYFPILRLIVKHAMEAGMGSNVINAVMDNFVNKVGMEQTGPLRDALMNLEFTGDGSQKSLEERVKTLEPDEVMTMLYRARGLFTGSRSKTNIWDNLLEALKTSGWWKKHPELEPSVVVNSILSLADGDYGPVALATCEKPHAAVRFNRPMAEKFLTHICRERPEMMSPFKAQIIPLLEAPETKRQAEIWLSLMGAMRTLQDVTGGVCEAMDVERYLDKVQQIKRPDRKEKKEGEKTEYGDPMVEGIIKAMKMLGCPPAAAPDVGSWGKMEFSKPPFVSDLKDRITKRKIRYGMEGPFRYPHRIHPAGDGTVFGTRRKVKGGTLLIDMSGSMNFNYDDIREIVTLLPASTIAGYSGSGKKGELVLIAEKGKIIDINSLRFHGGNVVDGPAVSWLVKQQKPLLFLSDGHCTGTTDRMHDNLTRELMSQIIRHRLIWLHDIGEAKRFIKTHSKMFLH